MTQVSSQEVTKKYSIVSHSQIPIWLDGQELSLTNVIYGQETAIYSNYTELRKGNYNIWGELTDVLTNEVSKIHIQYQREEVGGFVIKEANFRGHVGSQYNYRLVWDIISVWEYYYWAKTNFHYLNYS
jgi:hypothetical protein